VTVQTRKPFIFFPPEVAGVSSCLFVCLCPILDQQLYVILNKENMLMAFCFVPCGFVAHVFVPRASFDNNDGEMPWTIMQWQLFIILIFEALNIEDILQ
jgi:hypothetical protein